MNMNMNELSHVLHLQAIAYRIILWLNEQAWRDARRLSTSEIEKIRFGTSCREWVERVHGELPQELRVNQADWPALANLVAAFLQTSFTCHTTRQRWDGPLVPQLVACGEVRRARTEAVELERISLKVLAEDAGIVADHDRITHVVNDPAKRDDLVLWSYAVELVRRSRFASQGHAVHSLWKQLDPKARRKLKAEDIWAARSRLLSTLLEKRRTHREPAVSRGREV